MNLTQVLPKEWAASARLAELILMFTPLLLVAGLVAGKLINHWQYWHIFGEEDGPIEWFTALLYLFATPLAIMVARRFFKAGLALHGTLAGVLTLGLFFVGMEEISWGQRIFALTTPEFLAEVNRQQELNLHNIGHDSRFLDIIFITVSGYAATAFLWVPPLLRSVFDGRFSSLAHLVVPPAFLAGFFLPVFLLFNFFVASANLVDLFGPAFAYGSLPDEGLFILIRDQEPAEWIMAIGFFLFVCWLLLLQKTGLWDAGHAVEAG